MKRKRLFLLAIGVGVLVVLGIVRSTSYRSSSVYATERKALSDQIDQIGSQATYQTFKTNYQHKSFRDQHRIAHLLGELLYEKSGLGALAICDDSFGFGCYHSFFAQAMAKEGLVVIPKLDTVCADKFAKLASGCRHGIGHGLIEYFGADGLGPALSACQATIEAKPLLGCAAGVFMGYNMPVITSAEGAFNVPRQLDLAVPFGACPALTGTSQTACYFALPQWWSVVLKGDYQRIGKLCQTAPPKYQEACYLGAGRVAAPGSNFSTEETAAKCDQMPARQARVWCLAGASGSFLSVIDPRGRGFGICTAYLTGPDQEICQKKAALVDERI